MRCVANGCACSFGSGTFRGHSDLLTEGRGAVCEGREGAACITCQSADSGRGRGRGAVSFPPSRRFGGARKMRAPRRRRPRMREIHAPLDPVELAGLASRARYVGSPEHKDVVSFAGRPRLRADASCCPRETAEDPRRITRWLRSAIREGATGAPWEGGFPRYVWYKHGETVFEGRLVNRETGEYKGYPLDRDEWPRGVEETYAGQVRD